MARQLNMPHIRRVILRVNIVMLQNPLRIEVVNKSTITEMIMDFLGFFFVYLCRDVRQAFFDPLAPLGLLLSDLFRDREGVDVRQ